MSTSMLQAALLYVELGYKVFPLISGTKRPMTEHGFKDASGDPAQVRKWWAESPAANIGIATGKVIVVDVDGPQNPWPDRQERLDDLAGMPRSTTPGGGRHYYMRLPDGSTVRCSESKIARKVDVRGHGGYIVAPPSRVDGRSYEWLDGCALARRPEVLPMAPGWLAADLARSSAKAATRPKLETPLGEGERNSTLTSAAGRMRQAGFDAAAILVQLRRINEQRCVPPLEDTELVSISESVGAYASGAQSDCPTVVLGPDEHRVADEVIAELAKESSLFAKGPRLVRAHAANEAPLFDAVPTRQSIHELAHPNLRELITRRVGLVHVALDGKVTPAHPPEWLVNAVAARGSWRGIRQLSAVCQAPFLRPDGTVCQEPGYDAATGVLLVHNAPMVAIAVTPTREDAQAAISRLSEVVCDFAFQGPQHRAGWLALILTIVGRFSFRGPAPLFLIDANVRGAGKSLLVQAASMIALGVRAAASGYPESDAEMRKQITAHLLAGDRFVNLDNLPGHLGYPALDRLLTCETWEDRILGSSKSVSLRALAVWSATGNNTALKWDAARRVVPIRLEVLAERPEERDGFRVPDLLGFVSERRRELLADALTVLAAYVNAGRPRSPIVPLGGFEGWSNLVRAALVWAGVPDPCTGRAATTEDADEGSVELGLLLLRLKAFAGRAGFTVADLLKAVYGQTAAPMDRLDSTSLRSALESVVGCRPGTMPTSRDVGTRFRAVRRRVVGGLWLDCGEKSAAGAVWRIHPADTDRARQE